MSQKSSLALIVPCYNESETIPYFATELRNFRTQFKQKLPDWDLSVIVVDNNSTDNSIELLQALQKQTNGFNLLSCKAQGYGAALKHGFSLASADYLAFLDLDNTYPMTSLFELLNKQKAENSDIVYGARIHNASEISLIRYLGNQFYVVLLKYLFRSKLTDVCSGMRVFRSSLKNHILELKSDDLSFSIDFTATVLKNDWKISEHPIPYRNRIGESKLSVVKDGSLFLLIVLKNYFKKNRINV